MKQKINELVSQMNNTESRQHFLALVAIIGIGFILRFYAYFIGEGYHFFSINDEVSAFRVAMSFLAGEERAMYLGQPNFSDGHAPGPAWSLFWAAAYKLGLDSVDYALFVVAIFNTVLIYFVYRLARQFLLPSYALLATFLFATSPWPVYFAVGLWNPMPIAFLGVLLFLSLWRVTQVDNSRAIFWVCLVTALIPHFHMIGIFYAPAILLVLYLSSTRINRGVFIAGIVAGCAVYLPYLIGELQHDWENTRLVLAGSKEWSFSTLKIITAPMTVLSNHPGRWPGDEFHEFIAFGDKWFGSYYLLILVNLISMVMAATFIFWVLNRFVKQARLFHLKETFKQHPKVTFVVIMLVLPLLLFTLTGQNYSSRYTILILPLLFLLPAWYLQEADGNKFKDIIKKLMPAMILMNFYVLTVFYIHQNAEINHGSFLVTSFKKLEVIRTHLKTHAGTDVYIKIDAREYITDTTDKIENAGIALTDYVDIYEQYLAHQQRPDKEVVYKIMPETDSVDESAIAYRGNNTLIVRQN